MPPFFDWLLPPFTVDPWIMNVLRSAARHTPVVENLMSLRQQGITYVDRLLASVLYRQNAHLPALLHRFKYVGDVKLARLLGELMYCTWHAQGEPCREFVLCPVPLFWWRKWQRGFNQSELLGKEVAWRTGLQCAPLLRRMRSTGHQVGRSRLERQFAVKNAFIFNAEYPVPARVLLIDDVCTTGATLDACAKALKTAGVSEVWALVLARD